MKHVIYEPREDSLLLRSAVKKLAKGKVLDMGTGSGILALAAASKRNVKSVLAVDKNRGAVKAFKKAANSIKIVVKYSDLFSNVSGKFDTIIFNPPYLPDDPRVKDIALDGGPKGYELTEKFLSSVNEYLTDDGVVLLLISTLTKKKIVEDIILDNCLDFEIVGSEKIPHEMLYVYKIFKSSLLKELEKKGLRSVVKFSHGKRGNIFVGVYRRKKVAIKAKRVESEAQGTINREFDVLKKLNKEGIGPNVLFSGKDYFVYEFVPGKFILDYFAEVDRPKTIRVLKNVMRQMRQLDLLGYNKEEMHHPYKHVVVGRSIVLLDFERCTPTENVQNVTQFCQFLISGMLKKVVDLKFDRRNIIKLAREYKKDYSEKSFRLIMEQIK